METGTDQAFNVAFGQRTTLNELLFADPGQSAVPASSSQDFRTSVPGLQAWRCPPFSGRHYQGQRFAWIQAEVFRQGRTGPGHPVVCKQIFRNSLGSDPNGFAQTKEFA